MSDKAFNVLFLCTCNSARSLLAEAQLNAMGNGRFRAFSAGSFPTGAVNPNAIEFLEHIGLPTDEMRSKSWDEFAVPEAPDMDYIVTLCDDAAEDQCPIWPGHPIAAHWRLSDPAKVKGSDEAKRHAFMEAGFSLRKRIELLISLPTSTLNRISIKHHLDEIGKTV